MKKKLFLNYIYNIAYQGLILLLPLITSSLLTRRLGADNLGIYGYVNSIVSIFCTIGLIGLYSYGTREVAYCSDSREKLNEVYSEIELLRIFLLFVVSIPYFLISIFSDYKLYFFLSYLNILGAFFDPSWVYVGKEEMGYTVLKNAAIKITAFLGIVFLIQTSDDLWIYFLIISSSLLLGNLSLYFGINKYVSFKKTKFKNSFKHLSGSFKLFIPQIAMLLYLQVDKIMLKWLCGTFDVAIYEYSEKIINMPLTIITVFGTVMLPRLSAFFSSKKNDEIENSIRFSIAFQLLLALPMTFGIFLICDDFIPWFYSSEFVNTIKCIKILCPIIISNTFINIFSSQYLTATNQTKIMSISYLLTLLFNIIANYWFIHLFGAFGAAITTVLSSFLCSIILLLYVNKQIRVISFIFKQYKYLLFSLVMSGAVYVLSLFLNSSWLSTIIEIGVGIFIYLIMLLITKDSMINSLKKNL